MTLNQNEFLRRARACHGDRYDYSRSVYVTKDRKILIGCPFHGSFEQRPDNHWNGHGCHQCVHDKWGSERRKARETFVEDARAVHGERYCYELVVYRRNSEKVRIVCPLHEVFEQSPNEHLSGSGCPRCAGTAKSTTEEFVRRAVLVHRGRYEYTRVRYVNRSTKVEILCRRHGAFFVTPTNHLFGRNGCPRCQQSKGELAVAEWLEEHGVAYKPQKRFATCRRKRPLPFDFYVPLYDLLIEFDGDQHRGNWPWPDAAGRTARSDRIKTDWCRANGKLLLRIPRINAVASSLKAAILGEAPTKLGRRVMEELQAQRHAHASEENET